MQSDQDPPVQLAPDEDAGVGFAAGVLASLVFMVIAPAYVHVMYVIGRWSWTLIG